MFCKECGSEMNNDAKFCPKCGAGRNGEVKEKVEKKDDGTVKFQLRPKFNIPYKVITIVGRVILYFILIMLCEVDLIKLFTIYPITLLVTVIILLIYIGGKLILEKMQYDDLEFNFYANKVEYKDGFLNKEEKELKYKYIREVTMSQNIIERMFNIGKIRLFSNASSGYAASNGRNRMMNQKNGINIHCVENVQEQYKNIKAIIDEGMED